MARYRSDLWIQRIPRQQDETNPPLYRIPTESALLVSNPEQGLTLDTEQGLTLGILKGWADRFRDWGQITEMPLENLEDGNLASGQSPDDTCQNRRATVYFPDCCCVLLEGCLDPFHTQLQEPAELDHSE